MRKLTLILLMLFPLFSTSCVEIDPTLKYPIVYIIYPIEGLGDMGYVDNLYKGAVNAGTKHEIEIKHLMPSSLAEARLYLNTLVNEEISKVPHLYIIAESSIESEVEAIINESSNNSRKSYLVWETSHKYTNASSVKLSMYGISYIAGKLAAKMEDVDSVCIMKANPFVSALDEAEDGFIAGFGNSGETETLLLSGEAGRGFSLSSELYRKASEFNKYDIILPLCGGSSNGLIRYCREYPDDSFYTIGIDADMSMYSSKVPFSCVKHTDLAIELCIEQWLNGSLPQHQVMGLKEGMTEVVISPLYSDFFGNFLQLINNEAINKENKYENK